MKPLDFKLFVLRPSNKINKWIPLNPGRPCAKWCTVLASKVAESPTGEFQTNKFLNLAANPESNCCCLPREAYRVLPSNESAPSPKTSRCSARAPDETIVSWLAISTLTKRVSSSMICGSYMWRSWGVEGKIATGKTSFAHRQEYRGTRQDWQLTSRWCTVINIFSASTWLPKTQGTHGVTKSTKSLNHCEAQLPATPVGKGGTYEIPWKWWTILVPLVWKISSNTKNIPINCCCCLVVLSDKKWKPTRES